MPIDLRRFTSSAPDLSVIVPTSGRPDAIVRLLEALSRQTLPADRFEVVVTDDGSSPPVAPLLARLALPYAMQCEWQPRRGPAAARNRAIARARGRLLVILNDDAFPPDDLLARHLAAHSGRAGPRAWLGGFEFGPEYATPFADAASRLGLLFPFHEMKRDGPNAGNFFWTCNVSVPRAELLAAGGFDERFQKPICEDVELGHRLHARGVGVWFLDGAPCLHHHRVDVAWFVRRQIELGRGIVQIARKHGAAEHLPWLAEFGGDEEVFAERLEQLVRSAWSEAERFTAEIDAIDRGTPSNAPAGKRAAAAASIETRLRRVNRCTLALGLLAGLRGLDSPTATQEQLSGCVSAVLR